jgi:hypothetical protein
MTLTRFTVFSILAACSSSSPTTPDVPVCPSGNCGQTSFRTAVPTRAKVRIQRPTGVGQRRAPLDQVSPALLAVDERVVTIDKIVDELFTELEASATTTPEVETDLEHVWRSPDPELAGRDDVLRITTTNEVDFQIAYYIVPQDAAAAGAPVIRGNVKLAADDEILDFDLTVDLGAYTTADPAYKGRGEILIAAMPFAAGVAEHWFDFRNVSIGNSAVVNTLTTAWTFADDSGSLEYIADVDGVPTTAYARWDARGGRYDHHSQYVDANLGFVDEIMTNCWGPTGAEDFDAWAVIDEAGYYYGELDGNEGDCSFGPVADHPDPGTDFADLPPAGTWVLLDLLSL